MESVFFWLLNPAAEHEDLNRRIVDCLHAYIAVIFDEDIFGDVDAI